MEKNKNRTDLLAAGRKKVILFALNSDFAWFRNVQHLKCLLKFDDWQNRQKEKGKNSMLLFY